MNITAAGTTTTVANGEGFSLSFDQQRSAVNFVALSDDEGYVRGYVHYNPATRCARVQFGAGGGTDTMVTFNPCSATPNPLQDVLGYALTRLAMELGVAA